MTVTWNGADVRPDSDRSVVVFCPNDEADPVWIGYWDEGDDQWRLCNGQHCEPTHWAELPQPPTGDPS